MAHRLGFHLRFFRFAVCFAGLLLVAAASIARAGDDEANAAVEPSRSPASPEAPSPELSDSAEYNFSWLDPDKKVYVLQNRKFRKANRAAFFLSGGVNLSNPYRTERVLMPRLAYWFTEQLGVEALYATLSNSDNSNLTGLKRASPTALPFIRESRSYYALLATWAPWYAKINFFNKILYFDWFLNGGIGGISSAVDTNRRADSASVFKEESLTAGFFGTGMNFFLTRNFSVRLDFVGMMYSATGADNVTTFTTTNFDFVAGVGYLF